jgi:1-acyl-sn-glycerol-3-phosphate acyltransferase
LRAIERWPPGPLLRDHWHLTENSLAMHRPWRRAFRLLRLAGHVLLGTAAVMFVYPWASHDTRLALRMRWCRRVLRVLGVELRVVGVVPPGCHLIASNHVSWLDVFTIGAVFPCWFVAKDETRDWPFLGWMAAANNTLFLRRRSARAAYRMNAQIRARLEARQPVVVFPEGTTTDGSCVLNFYPALFQPAVDRELPVLPIAICYRDAASQAATAVAYIDDDPLWKSLCAVLDAPRTEARLVVGGSLSVADRRRRDLAGAACEAIRRAHRHQDAGAHSDEPRPVRGAPVFEPANASD